MKRDCRPILIDEMPLGNGYSMGRAVADDGSNEYWIVSPLGDEAPQGNVETAPHERVGALNSALLIRMGKQCVAVTASSRRCLRVGVTFGGLCPQHQSAGARYGTVENAVEETTSHGS